jgi:hypothetical protein
MIPRRPRDTPSSIWASTLSTSTRTGATTSAPTASTRTPSLAAIERLIRGIDESGEILGSRTGHPQRHSRGDASRVEEEHRPCIGQPGPVIEEFGAAADECGLPVAIRVDASSLGSRPERQGSGRCAADRRRVREQPFHPCIGSKRLAPSHPYPCEDAECLGVNGVFGFLLDHLVQLVIEAHIHVVDRVEGLA